MDFYQSKINGLGINGMAIHLSRSFLKLIFLRLKGFFLRFFVQIYPCILWWRRQDLSREFDQLLHRSESLNPKWQLRGSLPVALQSRLKQRQQVQLLPILDGRHQRFLDYLRPTPLLLRLLLIANFHIFAFFGVVGCLFRKILNCRKIGAKKLIVFFRHLIRTMTRQGMETARGHPFSFPPAIDFSSIIVVVFGH